MFHLLPTRRTLIAIIASLAAFSFCWADKISDLPIKTVNGRYYYTYEVQPKETVFSLTRRYGITSDELIKYNPSVADGLKAFMRLYFPVDVFGDGTTPGAPAASTPTVPAVTATVAPSGMVVPPGYTAVTIERGQSLFGIARTYNTTVDDILAANPNIDSANYKAGETILVPVGGAATATVKPSPVPQPEPQPEPQPQQEVVEVVEQDIVPPASVTEQPDTLMITLMLPLDLKAATPSKEAQYYLDFYRGFLVGVEQLSASGTPLKINLVDSKISADEFNDLIDSPTVTASDLFIGPDNEAQLKALAAKANETGAYILSPFVIKDELYQENPSIVQTNIPRNEMYNAAVETFMRRFKDATPVFLSRVEGAADKVEFTNKLKQRLSDENCEFTELTFRGVLTLDDMGRIDSTKNIVFIPVSSSRTEFGKIVPGLTEFKNLTDAHMGSIALFGYPDWTTLRGDQLEKLKALNGVIYSRFGVADSGKARDAHEDYQKWYGEDWLDVEPNQALLGFDTAQFAITNLRNSNGDFFPSAASFYEGAQGAFFMQQPFEGAGYVNGALYVLDYSKPLVVGQQVMRVPVKLQLGQ